MKLRRFESEISERERIDELGTVDYNCLVIQTPLIRD